jgi:hypothetical protein
VRERILSDLERELTAPFKILHPLAESLHDKYTALTNINLEPTLNLYSQLFTIPNLVVSAAVIIPFAAFYYWGERSSRNHLR